MQKTITISCLIICLISNVFAQDSALYQKKVFFYKRDTMPYRLLLPKKYDPAKKYPIIIVLHGSGEKGNDNAAELLHGGPIFAADSIREKYPAIVVFPQCPKKSNWVDDKRQKDSSGKYNLIMQADAKPTAAMQTLQKLVKEIIHRYEINKKMIYVGGLSLGGMGTYDIVKRNPRLFAAAFPICGAADVGIVSKLKHVKWWVFHGADDKNVSPEFDKKIVAAMQQMSIPVKFTLYPNTGHNSWDKAFAEPNLFVWLFSQKK